MGAGSSPGVENVQQGPGRLTTVMALGAVLAACPEFNPPPKLSEPGKDTTPPVLAVASQAEDAVVAGAIAVAATAEDPESGIATVEFRVQARRSGIELNEQVHLFIAPPYQAAFDTHAVDDGAATFVIRAINRSGLETARSIGMRVDNTAPVVALDSPKGGELWSGTRTITWSTQDDNLGTVRIEYSPDGGASWTVLADGQSDVGTYAWDTRLRPDTEAARVRVTATDLAGLDGSDASSADFAVENTAPILSLTAPIGGEVWGGLQEITWTTADLHPGTVQIELSIDGGANWETLVADAADTGVYDWAASPETSRARIRLTPTDAAGNTGTPAASGADFVIDNTPPSVALLAPLGGEGWTGVQRVSWTTADANSETIRIDISSDGGGAWRVLEAGVPDTGSYDWDTAGATDTGHGRVRVTPTDAAGNTGEPSASAADLLLDNVAPIVTVAEPAAGTACGSTCRVAWKVEEETPATMDVAFRIGVAAWVSVATGLQAGTGSYARNHEYAWNTVAVPDATDVQVRVTARSAGGLVGSGDGGRFLVDNTPPAVILTSPNGGELWSGARAITWTTADAKRGTVRIDGSTDGGATWFAITEGAPDTGSHSWNTQVVADTASARVRIAATDAAGNTGAPAVSGADFTIDNTSPTPPGDVAVVPAFTGFGVAWTASSDASGIDRYEILYDTDASSAPYASSVTVAGNSASREVTGVGTCNTRFWIVVVAVDRAGNVSTPSEERTVYAGGCGGDGTFREKIDYITGAGPVSIAVGDFNADGILDLATAGLSQLHVSILLGNGADGRGDGTFQAKVDYRTAGATGPTSVVTGDFNADGILDLAAANQESATVAVLIGNGANGRGDGTFKPRVEYATGGTDSWSVLTGDFNADGILDLAVTTRVNSVISILLGNGANGRGDGTFAAKVDYATGLARAAAAGDFNADGILDLAVANYLDNVSVLLGNGTNGRGDGTFRPKVDYASDCCPRSIAGGDFNADGILDLAVGNASRSVSVLLGNGTNGRGDGTFKPKVDYFAGSGTDGVWSVTARDFNADRILDLAVANYGEGTMSVFLGNGTNGRGDGTFRGSAYYVANSGPTSVAAGDFNADGILDLALASYWASRVSIFRGNGANGRGDGTFGGPAASPSGGSHPRAVALGDFNRDGIADIAAATEAGVSVRPGNGSGARGNGSWGNPVVYAAGGACAAVVTGDFNTDQIADLAATCGGNLRVLIGGGSNGRGDGTFTVSAFSAPWGARALIAGDFNKDGVPDLAGTDGTGMVSVALANATGGRGDGAFTARVNYAAGTYPVSLAAADFNKDGVLDLVVGNAGGVSVLRGNGTSGRGNGTFAAKVDYPAGGGLAVLAVGDFNADSIIDIAAANEGSENLSVLLGNGAGGRGDGTFAAAQHYGAGLKAPRALIAGDFNHDAVLDLAMARGAGLDTSAVSVLIGNSLSGRGNGTFSLSAHHPFAGNIAATGLIAGDFNADGMLDLCTTSGDTGNVVLLPGRGTVVN